MAEAEAIDPAERKLREAEDRARKAEEATQQLAAQLYEAKGRLVDALLKLDAYREREIAALYDAPKNP